MNQIVKVYNQEPWKAEPVVWEPTYINVLDQGHIGLIDFMGDDSAIVNAARVSYGKGTVATRTDEGLIRYLMRHWHTTPFEMVEFKFHVKAPIFVFRQWHRHRTASINEYSGRYSILDNEMYVPHYTHTAPQSANNKQGRQDNLLDPEDYNAVRTALNHVNDTSYQTYLYLCGPNPEGIQAAAPDELQNRRKTIEAAAMAAIQKTRLEQASKPEDERWEITEDDIENTLRDWFIQSDTHVITKDYPGIARELARMVLPVATYSQMYWKANLHNIMHFLRLRADSHAQYEIRVYAEAMMDLITPIVPMAMEAFNDYQLHGTNLSRMEGELIKLARSGAVDFTDADVVRSELTRLGCSKREIDEFLLRY